MVRVVLDAAQGLFIETAIFRFALCRSAKLPVHSFLHFLLVHTWFTLTEPPDPDPELVEICLTTLSARCDHLFPKWEKKSYLCLRKLLLEALSCSMREGQ